MNGAEGVGHINLRQGSQLFGKGRVIFRLALFKAGVLQQQQLAGLQGGSLGGSVLPHHIVGEEHLLAQKLGQPLRHRGQGQLLQGFFPFLPGKRGGVLALLALLFHPFIKVGLGLTQVGAGDNGSAMVQQIADGGQGRYNALVAGDGAGLLILGHIEITAQKDFFAGNIHIGNGLFVVIHIIISLMDCDNGVSGAGGNGRRDTWVPPYNKIINPLVGQGPCALPEVR